MTALPFILLFVGSLPASAPVCVEIRAGDTAVSLAVRLTGRAANARQPWFQIVDPATSRVIPKADYDLITPNWQLCVPREVLGTRVVSARPSRMPAVVPVEAAMPLPALDLASVLLVAGILVTTMFGWSAGDEYFRKRRAMVTVMTRVGERFVREFERPLLRRSADDRPIRSTVRYRPGRERLDILLAPGAGHHYPNLADHRKNVEYDVERVLRLLNSKAIVSGPLHVNGAWVVVPLHLRDPNQRPKTRDQRP